MRKLCLIFLLYLFQQDVKAQNYCNEWINYSQQYFKFPVFKEAIYRIDSTTLSKYFNLAQINPANFQVFIKGKEQRLYIKGEGDGKINTGDFIQFYADGRAAEIDSLVYTNINYQPNPYVALFNDTLYAFITLNSSTTNKRYTTETDTNAAAYPAASYIYNETITSWNWAYNKAAEYPDDGSDPLYTQAEAKGAVIAEGDVGFIPLFNTFSSLNIYTGNPSLPVYFKYHAAGGGKTDQLVDHRYQLSYNDQASNQVFLADTTFLGCLPIRQTFTINPQTLGNSCTFSFVAASSMQFVSYNNVAAIYFNMLYYPQLLSLGNNYFYKFHADDNPGPGKGFYNFSNFSVGTDVEFLDVTNGKYIDTKVSGSMLRAIVPNGGGRKLCVMMRSDSVRNIKTLTKIQNNGYFINYKTQTPGKPFVIVAANSLISSANEYKIYRQSAEGGAYNVVLGVAGDLYEQFGYGANNHPVAIRNFIRFLNDSLSAPTQYVLLIGHGAHPDELTFGPLFRSQNLLPALGVPASDQLYTATLNGTNASVPQIPIGRLSALSDAEVKNYLWKIKLHEIPGDSEWKKSVLHFVGGDDEKLVATLSNYMNVYKGIISDTLFGAQVTSFKKNTSSPIQTSINDSVFKTINKGCSILTFFGHSSLSSLDQAIDEPDRYNNQGRYPFFIANSCNSGDIFFTGKRSVSENFVLAEQKGSIGFIAPNNFAQDVKMYEYTQELLKAISITKYGMGLGDAIKEALTISSAQGQYQRLTGLTMTFHGDPSIKIDPGLLPDYRINSNSVSFDLKKYTDSIGIIINYSNVGVAKKGPITIKVERVFANGDTVSFFVTGPAPYFRDTVELFIPIDFDRGLGLNRFWVSIDHFNLINEKNEMNNSTVGSIDFFITGGDIYPVYPFKYAVVPITQSITLKANTSDPFAPSTRYIIQLDTSDKFTAPLQSTLVTSKGGVIEWNVNLPFADSTVYFWRVSRDSVSPTRSYLWRESSFQTIGVKRGWSQAHFNQFKLDKYQFVKYKADQRKFQFENSTQTIHCRDGFNPYIYIYAISYYFNAIRMSEFGCAHNGWNIAVFDSISGQPWRYTTSNSPNFSSANYCMCNPSGAVYSFGNPSNCGLVPGWQTDLENFMNSIPKNNYVLAFNLGYNPPSYANVSSYSNSLYSAFESIGAKTIRTTPDTVPYILFGRKGMNAGQGNETVGKLNSSIITLTDSIKTKWYNGYIASEKIGPSYRWNSLHWRVKSLESTPGDSTVLKVVGFKTNGTIDTLATFKQGNFDITNLSDFADAAIYPYLQLVALMQDNVNLTSPQLKRWQVLYEEAAECAINPLKGFGAVNDTLQEGDNVEFYFPIENIGNKSFDDSLAISYWIEDTKRNKINLPDRIRKGPFVPGQIIIDTLLVNSYQLLGGNGLWVNVNPLSHRLYQKEGHAFNNVAHHSFKVNGDITNPLLEVTFDGVRILNGDIVSAKPNILITLRDENKFLALNDTGAFTVFIEPPGQPQQRVYFAKDLIFTPANLPKNSCNIQYNPVLQTDGKYMLIVQARDRSSNASGVHDYRIQFEINNKPTVTSVLNYPNPFSTNTKFVFTLTGSEVPEVFTIRILTITGKVVREITREELGHLHIGRNITEYGWDGRDTYGDRLANGVYLYHVITRLNGETIEKNGSAADKYFVKEYGKMVLLR